MSGLQPDIKDTESKCRIFINNVLNFGIMLASLKGEYHIQGITGTSVFFSNDIKTPPLE